MLSLIGGALGVAVAFWTADMLASFRPEGTEGIWRNYSAVIRPDTVSLNSVEVLFHFAAAMLAGVFFGFVPALHSSRPDFNQALKTTRTGTTDRLVRILRLNTRAGVAALLVFVAVAATWIPARRALSVEPWVALRYE